MKDKDTPLKLVRLWPKMMPDCYQQLDLCRIAKVDGEMEWPDYCLLPINAAYTYLIHIGNMQDSEAASLAAELTACWMWRQNKVIYQYDADLVSVLREQANEMSDCDILPSELLMHMPYPCIYVKAPSLLEHVDGFWTWVDFDTNHETPELRFQWLLDDMEHSVPQVLHINPAWTIQECLTKTAQRTAEALGNNIDEVGDLSAKDAQLILSAIQLVLYLVSQDADIADVHRPLTPQKTKTHTKNITLVQDKAGEIDCKDVGIRIGAAIRKARVRYKSSADTANSGGIKRPHARRGHWHHYWVGQIGSADRKLVLKWTAPTFIHANDFDGKNTVIYPIKK